MACARNGLGTRFISVLPQLTSQTDLGAVAVAAYGSGAYLLAAAGLRELQ